MLAVWAAALWGLAGGLCVEALELYARIKRAREWSWSKPIPQGRAAYWTSVVIRAGVGALLAAAAAASDQVSGAFAALGLGVAAPLVVEAPPEVDPAQQAMTANGAAEGNPSDNVSAQEITDAP
jgi:hypothetical protein